MNFQFEDFTEINYRRLIRLAKDRYPFVGFHESLTRDNFVLWRHDIDLSVHRALSLGGIEAEEGVQATYFVLLGGGFYNPFERETKLKLIALQQLGHELALHFDPTSYEIRSSRDLEHWLCFEARILENQFGKPIRVFSIHNPATEILESARELYCGGMLNAYSAHFRENVTYCSDSNGYWRFNRLEDVILSAPPKLHVLTHPGMWQREVMSPRERVMRCIRGRAENQQRNYDETLRAFGRENI